MTKTGGHSKKPRIDTKAKTGEPPSSPSARLPEPYAVLQTSAAEADLARVASVDEQAATSLKDKLLGMGGNPYATDGLVKLGKDAYRIRQGDWRALLLINDEQRVVLVERVKRRNESTYK
jgi:mRNA-degrading endonuclease RelE of RelBE toxin-antitoxin system